MLENQTKKSFWSKPEGFTGTLFLGAIGVAIFWFWGKIVPFVLMTLTNTIYTVIAASILALIVYMFLDPNVRAFAWYLYKVSMRKLTSIFVQIDPIAIIKAYIGDLKNKRGEMNEQITTLKGQMGKLDRAISENENEIKNSLNRAQKAKDMSAQNPALINEVTLSSREAGRLKASNDKLLPLKLKMEKMYQFLNKMYDSSGYLIRDMESEISSKEKEYAAIKASHSAMKGALSIINGDGNKKMIFDEAMEFLQDDMGRKVGEMERFMEMSTSFINGVDIQNGVYEDEAFKMLDAYNESDFTFLLDGNKNSKTVPVNVPLIVNTSLPSKKTYDLLD